VCEKQDLRKKVQKKKQKIKFSTNLKNLKCCLRSKLDRTLNPYGAIMVENKSIPHTPQQNGVAERANRTLVEMARSMMVHSSAD